MTACIERDANGIYTVYLVHDMPGYSVQGQGRTVQEALQDFQAVYQNMKRALSHIGSEWADEELEYQYDVASFLSLYSHIFTLAGLARVTGVSQSQLSHYLNGVSQPSARTVKKIQDALTNLSEQLAQIKLK